jgi:hypothetical protein
MKNLHIHTQQEKKFGSDLQCMLGFRHKDSKAQSGTKESKKKKVTLSASFCFCVFVAIKHTPKENFNTAYIANQYHSIR